MLKKQKLTIPRLKKHATWHQRPCDEVFCDRTKVHDGQAIEYSNQITHSTLEYASLVFLEIQVKGLKHDFIIDYKNCQMKN